MDGTTQGKRALVVGCGGIGGVTAATLLESPTGLLSELAVLSTNEAIARAVNERGFRLRGVDGVRTVPGRVRTSIPDGTEPYDYVLLATQPVRSACVARLGERGFLALFSAVAVVGFTLLVRFYAAHRFEGPAGLALAGHGGARLVLILVIVVLPAHASRLIVSWPSPWGWR